MREREIQERLALWTRWAATTGRSLGERLRSMSWREAALYGASAR